jgi:mannonate dehydratase
MEQTWRRFGLNDPICLAEIRQTGVAGIVTARHDIPCGVWSGARRRSAPARR